MSPCCQQGQCSTLPTKDLEPFKWTKRGQALPCSSAGMCAHDHHLGWRFGTRVKQTGANTTLHLPKSLHSFPDPCTSQMVSFTHLSGWAAQCRRCALKACCIPSSIKQHKRIVHVLRVLGVSGMGPGGAAQAQPHGIDTLCCHYLGTRNKQLSYKALAAPVQSNLEQTTAT